ncbi:glycosyltransferase family 32 protein [Lampropedia puyangensis]|nr:capsular polysaccharide synthesis protein [Lampropedia puyangensis]
MTSTWSIALVVLLVLIGLGLLALGAAVWVRRHSRLQSLPAVQEVVLDDGCVHAQQEIPRTIWTYWHEPTPPYIVQRCIAGWKRLNPGVDVHVLHPGNLAEFLPYVPDTLARLNIAKQTDWIRLALLHRYGGMWLDASIILTQPLDWVDRAQKAEQAEFVGFYLQGYTTRAAFPVIESWFLAAAPGSRFITQWLERFEAAAVTGDTADYLEQLRAQGRYEALTQKIGDPSYHTIHVVAQEVLQSQPREHTPMRLCLLRAEDSAYWLHVQSGWKRRPLFARLLWAQGSAAVWPPLVKLRGGERSKLNAWLVKRHYRQGSLVERHLAAHSDQPNGA